MGKIGIALLFCVFVLPFSSAAQNNDQLNAALVTKDAGYRIGYQDIVDVQVFRHPDLNQRVPVESNGSIVLFRLDHPVVAVCKTESELAADIEKAYKEKYLVDPQVKVSVADQKSQFISVIGAVEKPGTYFVNRQYQLLEILAVAGGPNKEAGTRLIVARTGSRSSCKENTPPAGSDSLDVSEFKIRDVQEGKKSLLMRPGDVVSVLDADVVYVYGNVKKQGALRVREPITLTQAIASAEGLNPNAKKEKVRILRQKEGAAEREELTFDLGQIDKGKIKDPYLEPNDIVAVSEDKTKTIMMGITNMLKSTVPGAVYRLPLP